jgi:hypothetical protein
LARYEFSPSSGSVVMGRNMLGIVTVICYPDVILGSFMNSFSNNSFVIVLVLLFFVDFNKKNH